MRDRTTTARADRQSRPAPARAERTPPPRRQAPASDGQAQARRERPYWLALTVVLALIALVAGYGFFDARGKLEGSRQREQALSAEVDSLNAQLGSAQLSAQQSASAATVGPSTGTGDQHITVQHILIGFKGSVPDKDITRSQEEAKTLAYDIFNRAKGGEDFDQLVKTYTDDSYPGTYSMANTGVAPAQGEAPREGMVPAFGNVGFSLKTGEIGIADYDPQNSPFGWHIIKRVK